MDHLASAFSSAGGYACEDFRKLEAHVLVPKPFELYNVLMWTAARRVL